MKPLPTTEEEEKDPLRFVWTSDTQFVSRIITQELVIRALKLIAKTLNEQELAAVTDWAWLQTRAFTITTAECLQGNKYLRVEPPYFDFPSVLDYSIPDETTS
jgi:hypothetical protein